MATDHSSIDASVATWSKDMVRAWALQDSALQGLVECMQVSTGEQKGTSPWSSHSFKV